MGKKSAAKAAARAARAAQIDAKPFRFAPTKPPMAPGTLPGALEGLAMHRDIELMRQIAANDQTFTVPANNKKLDIVFGIIERILTDMEQTGEVETMPDGTPIYFNEADQCYYPIAGSFHSICDTFDMLAETHRWTPQPPGLRDLAKKFDYGMVMAQHDTDAARVTIAWMRECMLTITPNQFTQASMVINQRDELVHQHRMQKRRA